MVSERIRGTLKQKSSQHTAELRRLENISNSARLSNNVVVISDTNQTKCINTMLQDPALDREDFIFYFDRLIAMLIEKATDFGKQYTKCQVTTPVPGELYNGLRVEGEVSAVVILRGGSCMETGLKRVIPDCRTGRMLIQTSSKHIEPELHYFSLMDNMADHQCVLLLDPQMSSGGAALMAVRVLIDHGVAENKIVFVTYMAGSMGLARLTHVYPDIKVVVCRLVEDSETRWVEERYLGC